MTKEEMIKRITDLKELIRMKEDLEEEIEMTKNVIKDGMEGKDEIVVGAFKVSNKEVTTTRLDTVAMKKKLDEKVLAPFWKTSTTRRFIVA